jgi:large subunit ribosomal protein L15
MKRLPQKRGFTNIFRQEYNVVNVGQLNVFAPNAEITAEALLKMGLVKSTARPVKLLGSGLLKQPLTVRVNKVSQAAREKVAAAGGRVEEP